MWTQAITIAILLAATIPSGVVAMSDAGPAPVASTECQSASPDATPGTSATPIPALPDATPPLTGVDEIDERDLPPGGDASSDIVAALLALELQYAACLNAGDYAALLPLFDTPLREEAAAVFSDPEEPPVVPSEPSEDNAIDTVALRCVRTYPGGYALALLEWGADGRIEETNVRIYRDIGMGWVAAGEVTAYGQHGEGCETT